MMCYQMTKEWTILFQWDQHHGQYDEASTMCTKKTQKRACVTLIAKEIWIKQIYRSLGS